MARRRTYRRRRMVRRRITRRIPKSVVRTTAFPIPVRGQPRPVLGPSTAWHKRVCQFSFANTGTSEVINNFTWANLLSSWVGLSAIPTGVAGLKIRWIKLYNVTLGKKMTADFLLSSMLVDNSQPNLSIQDYGTANSLASVGMKIPYLQQNIQAAPVTTAALVAASVPPQSEVLCVFGFSFRM